MRHRGPQLPWEPDRKRRTREHVIADLSYNLLERKVLLRGHWLDAPRKDYGVDAIMFHHGLHVQSYVEQRPEILESESERVKLRVPLRNKLTLRAIDTFRELSLQFVARNRGNRYGS